MKRTTYLLSTILPLGLLGPTNSWPQTHPETTHTQASSHPVDRQWIAIRHVTLHLTDHVILRVRMLHGEMFRTNPAQPAALDDSRSFRIRITAASVALTGTDLAALLNTVVFAYPGAPLRDLRARTDGQELILTGLIHKVVSLRFRIRGIPSLMPDGRLRIHPTAVRILGVNGEKLLHTVGLHLDNVLDLSGARGVTVKGDDLFLEPTMILPPPAIEGRLAAVYIKDSTLVQDFVRQADDSMFRTYVRSDSNTAFIYFRGGQLRFGHLLMNDTDLRIVNIDSTEHTAPFDMNLPQYSRQLVAGYSRTHANLGLTAYMPNFATLPERQNKTPPTAAR